MSSSSSSAQSHRSTSPVASTSTSAQVVTSTRPHVQSTRPNGGGSNGSSNAPRSGSISSNLSAPPTSHMESTITRLLVATKQLLEGLAKWSRGEVGEEDISEIYVKLGNDFNVACAAFARESIPMNELLNVPSDLRVCLEMCLSEPPSQATLERHLPKVRQIIIGLLHGLREKQRLYRDGVAKRRQRERDAQGSTSSQISTQGRSMSASGPSSSTSSLPPSVSTTSALPKDPLTPNSAHRSRDELRKFVTQAQASSSAGPTTVTSATSTPQHRTSLPAQPPQHPAASRPVASSSSDPSLQSSSTSTVASRFDDATVAQRRPLSRSNSTRGDQAASLVSESQSHPTQSSTRAPIASSSRQGGSLRDSTRHARPTLEGIATAVYPERPSLQQTRSTGSITQAAGPPRLALERTRTRSPPPFSRREEEDEPTPTPRTPTFATTAPVGRPESMISTSSHSNEDHQAAAAQLESLEALKASDNLSRRASKRYSAYAISKMTMSGSASSNTLSGMAGGSPLRGGGGDESGRSKSTSSRSGQGLQNGPNGASPRRAKTEYGRSPSSSSLRNASNLEAPPLPPLPGSLSSQEFRSVGTIMEESEASPKASAPERDRNRAPPMLPLPPTPRTSGQSAEAQRRINAADALSNAATATSPRQATTLQSPLPSLPTNIPPRQTMTASSSDSAFSDELPFPVFLQIGRDVKKTVLDEPPTLSSLRLLFVERFGFNPGQADFPSVYIRDQRAGVDYELEDMNDVRSGSVLSLNIDSVEQVKLHIDQGLSALSQEMKELRSTMTAMRRVSVSAHHMFSPEPSGHSPSQRPTERQFQDAAQKVVKMRKLGSTPNFSTSSPVLGDLPESDSMRTPAGAILTTTATDPTASSVEPERAQSPTQSSSGDAFTAQVVGTLKTQHQEVQSLRREIGIIRQVYLDFAQTTKDMISNVRVQSSHVHRLASTKITTDRTFVEAGTSKLDGDSTDLVVKVDELTDTIDQMRADTVRGIRAKPSQLSEMNMSMTRLSKTRDELASWLASVKPKWQEAWSNELAKVLGEQERVQNQEALLVELGDDLDDVRGVLKNLEVVSKQPRSGRGRDFSVGRDRDSVDGSDVKGGLGNVLYEVQGLRPDPARRLEAIARAEKQRELDNANRTDEFEQELSGFVKEGKLKKSGGIEETERIRQARSEKTLKAMFS